MPFSNAFYQKHSIKCQLQIPSAECNIQMPFSKCYHKMPFSKCFHKMPFSKCFYKMPFSKSFHKMPFSKWFPPKAIQQMSTPEFRTSNNWFKVFVTDRVLWSRLQFQRKMQNSKFFWAKKSFNRCRQSLLQQHLQHYITQVMISASWPSTLKL